MSSILRRTASAAAALLVTISLIPVPARASSHSEAPLISMDRYADNTDVYAFRSTEAGRSGFVTIVANFIPFQDPSSGPQFSRFDDTVLYEIKIDNDGDGKEDVAYQFQFKTQTVNGDTILGMHAVNQDAVISSLADPDYNMPQTYTVTKIGKGTGKKGTVIGSGLRTPPANIGPRVTPDYEANLGSQAVYNLTGGGRVFAGQRDESFYIDVGAPFDALNFTSIGASGGIHSTQGFNISSIAIEVPISALTRSRAIPSGPTANDAVVGIWSTTSRRSERVIRDVHERNNADDDEETTNDGNGRIRTHGPWRQISRLGNPLVNEVVTPLRLKDQFNSSSPKDDEDLVPAVLDPELARLMNFVFGIAVPPAPRNDLALIFALGIPVNPITGPNFTTVIAGTDKPHEYLRLNVAIPPSASPNRLGLLGGDPAGFPNGRRPGDDVVDIALRAMAGGTPFTPATNVAPNNTLGDGVSQNDVPYLTRFPYLGVPNQGNTARTANFPAP